METKIDMLIESVNSLSVQIQKLIVQETVGEDVTLATYLNRKNMYDFLDKETTIALREYTIYKDNINPYAPNVSQIAFNRAIKKVFNELTVGNSTRHGKSIQYFKRKN